MINKLKIIISGHKKADGAKVGPTGEYYNGYHEGASQVTAGRTTA